MMPLPPESEDTENTSDQLKIHFSHVECLMYAFHKLAAKWPEFLTGEENSERLKDFRLRYLHAVVFLF